MKTLIKNLFIALALFVGIHQAAAQTSFVLSTNYAVYPTNGGSQSVVAFTNADGLVDLVYSANSPNGGSLTLLTNNGSGIFTSNQSYTVGNGPVAVIAADVNGDGKMDLICANQGSDTLSVLTNNGSGGFVPASSPYVSNFAAPTSVAAFKNVDGKVDLACANAGLNTISIFTNIGGGNFIMSPTNLSVGNTPHSVTAADVNNDGAIDLICANENDNTLSVLTNNGSGGFVLAATVPVPLGSKPVFVVASDVNKDGWVDLISANFGNNTLSVVTNNRSGGFALATNLPVGSDPYSVCAADVNGDGWPDLISACGGVDSLTVMTNDGSGGFGLATNLPLSSGSGWVVAADVNGDGKVDLINTIAPTNAISVFFNTSTFPLVIPFTYTTNNGTITITGYTGPGGAAVIPATINGYPVTSIGNYAFAFLGNLTNVTIPNSVTSIGAYAFSNCYGLSSMNFPNSVTSIGDIAFLSCTDLKNIMIPNGVTNLGEIVFDACTSMTNITVASSNPNYSSVNGVLFDKAQMTLIEFPGGLSGSYAIPTNVTNIGILAFYACILNNVTIPNSVTSIGTYAFNGCSSLSSIYFGGNAPSPTSDTTVFGGDNSAVAYYLPNTTGWGPTFDGIPAVELLPPPPPLGMSTYGGRPVVFFPTATGTNYVLLMTTNLNAPVTWVAVTNGVPISGIIVTNGPANAFFQLQ